MTSAIYDFKAIKAATLAFPEDRPQNVVKPTEQPPATPPPQSHIYDYADGAFPADYSCFHAFAGGVTYFIAGGYDSDEIEGDDI